MIANSEETTKKQETRAKILSKITEPREEDGETQRERREYNTKGYYYISSLLL